MACAAVVLLFVAVLGCRQASPGEREQGPVAAVDGGVSADLPPQSQPGTAAPLPFPGDPNAQPFNGLMWPSPDGKHCLMAFFDPFEKHDAYTSPFRGVYMWESSSTEMVRVYAYQRDVTIRWSPRGDRYAMTDDYASNENNCVIASAGSEQFALDLKELVLSQVDPETAERLGGCDKFYINPVSWNGNDALLIDLDAWRAGEYSITKRFECSVPSGELTESARLTKTDGK